MFTGRGKQLSIFIGETDSYGHQSLHIAIVEMLRRRGCGGATVTRGLAGFGASSLIHTASILRLSMDLPVVITVVDRPERIDRMIDPLRQMAPHALITVQTVEIVQSSAPLKEGLPDVKVSEVMRTEVATVGPDAPLASVVELLRDKDFTAVPVIDAGRKVIGMVSDSDLLTRGGMNVTLSLQRVSDPDFVNQLKQSLNDQNRKVSDVMTRTVVAIGPAEVLGRAARLMVEKGLKRLPVVDSDGVLVGILGRLDILKTVAAVNVSEWHPEAPADREAATVGDVMNREVPSVKESASVEDVLDLLVSSTHKRVVVIDGRRHVAGIIADSDLISRVSRESRPGLIAILVARVPIGGAAGETRKQLQKLRARSAKDLMTRDVVTVREIMPVAAALALSAEKGIKRFPVVNAAGELVGIVGRAEMLRALLG